MRRAIVCGGRSFRGTQAYEDRLLELLRRLDVDEVVHGAAPGADSWAEGVALAHGYLTRAFPADWKRHGNAAGPIRNRTMAEYVRDGGGGYCIAFPGGRGTADMLHTVAALGLFIFDLRTCKEPTP